LSDKVGTVGRSTEGALQAEPKIRRSDLKFATAESFAYFIEGLRALLNYADESTRKTPTETTLAKNLTDSAMFLQRCVDKYPKDELPAFYLGIARALENQKRVASALAGSELFAAEQFKTALEENIQDPQKIQMIVDAALNRDLAGQPTPLDVDTQPLDNAIALYSHLVSSGEFSETARFNLAQMYSKRDKVGASPSDIERAASLLASIPSVIATEEVLLRQIGMESRKRSSRVDKVIDWLSTTWTLTNWRDLWSSVYKPAKTTRAMPQEEGIALGLQGIILQKYLAVRRGARTAYAANYNSVAEIEADRTTARSRDDLTRYWPALGMTGLPPAALDEISADYWNKCGFLDWEWAAVRERIVRRIAKQKGMAVDTLEGALGELQDNASLLDQAARNVRQALAIKPGWTSAQLTQMRINLSRGKIADAKRIAVEILGSTEHPKTSKEPSPEWWTQYNW
jgi:hypothetical protein